MDDFRLSGITSVFRRNHLQRYDDSEAPPTAEAPRLRWCEISCIQNSREFLYRVKRGIICIPAPNVGRKGAQGAITSHKPKFFQSTVNHADNSQVISLIRSFLQKNRTYLSNI